MIITFDCLKGKKALKEKLEEKEIEWYKVIFEDPESKILSSEEEEENDRNKKIQNKGKNKDFIWVTVWDLPLEYSKQEIRRLFKHFGKTEEINLKRLNYSQYAEIRILIHGEEQERKLRTNWAIGLENGKLARISLGEPNIKELREREGFRAIVTNIPSTAQETLLLRALRPTGAKTVYIPYNSNRNPSQIAKVFFETQEDMEAAMHRNVYYYNTKLFWKKNETYNTRKQKAQDFPKYRNKNLLQSEEVLEANTTNRINREYNRRHQRNEKELHNNNTLKIKLQNLQEEINNLNIHLQRIEQENKGREGTPRLAKLPNRS